MIRIETELSTVTDFSAIKLNFSRNDIEKCYKVLRSKLMK